MPILAGVLVGMLSAVVPAASSVASSVEASQVEGAGNVLWIVLDDVSPQFIGACREPRPDIATFTPQIDRLATKGMVFSNFYVNPTCTPTRVALLTGEHPYRTGLGSVDELNDLPLSAVTLPDALGDTASALIGIWKMGEWRWGDYTPIVHGFHLYHGKIHGQQDYFEWARTTSWRWRSRSEELKGPYQTTVYVDDTLKAVQDLDVPWFACLNLKAPHKPFHVPPDSLHTQGAPTDRLGRYVAMLEAADTEIGRLVSHLDLRRTTVFILADNGTVDELLLHPGTGKGSTYEGAVNCPLIVFGRGVAQGTRTNALASAVDLFSTTLDLMDRSGAWVPRDGVSLLPVLKDPAARVRDHVYGERFDVAGGFDHRYARDQRYKLRVDWNHENEWFHDLRNAPPGEDGPPLDRARLGPKEKRHLEKLREIVAAAERPGG